MGPQNICPLKFWVKTDRSLTAIAEELVRGGIISQFTYDSENVYEWFTSTPRGHDFELNVSRKHHDFEPPSGEPVSFLLIGEGESCPEDAVVREIASKIHAALQIPIYLGTIKYLGSDDYRYMAIEVIGG